MHFQDGDVLASSAPEHVNPFTGHSSAYRGIDECFASWLIDLIVRHAAGIRPATDGVVIHYRAFGTTGTAQRPFDHGRTATHEVGHYFNLRHIWGDTEDCRGGDSVADTPNCAGPNTGRPAFPKISCNNGPNGDMFMNFMDYTDDAAMHMFTTQQVARMRATLAGPRSGL